MITPVDLNVKLPLPDNNSGSGSFFIQIKQKRQKICNHPGIETQKRKGTIISTWNFNYLFLRIKTCWCTVLSLSFY